jgi:hypothetical protein
MWLVPLIAGGEDEGELELIGWARGCEQATR